jgi:hypothetical protein
VRPRYGSALAVSLQEGIDRMSSKASRLDQLRDFAVERLGGGVGTADLCRQVPALMAELLNAKVSVRFVGISRSGVTGGTGRCMDGSYIVCCVQSKSWYHRLLILLHELAHVLLEHKPVELNTKEGLRSFLTHLPDEMITLIAGRTDLTPKEERAAEELADGIIERLTETKHDSPEPDLPAETPDHVRRIADALEDRQEKA